MGNGRRSGRREHRNGPHPAGGERSRRKLETGVVPVPCIWSDGEWTSREIAVSANNPNMRLDTAGIEDSTRAVAEVVENLYMGLTSYSAYGGTISGLMNTTGRFTKVLTAPTGSNGNVTVDDVISMIQTLKVNGFRGPYIGYYNTPWSRYLAQDYRTTYSQTLRQRMTDATPNVVWREAENLPTDKFRIIIVQMTNDVIDAILGQDITVVQWEGEGGFANYYKVWTINNPRVRLNGYGKTGINEGVSA
jgi:hypothetical protein